MSTTTNSELLESYTADIDAIDVGRLSEVWPEGKALKWSNASQLSRH